MLSKQKQSKPEWKEGLGYIWALFFFTKPSSHPTTPKHTHMKGEKRVGVYALYVTWRNSRFFLTTVHLFLSLMWAEKTRGLYQWVINGARMMSIRLSSSTSERWGLISDQGNFTADQIPRWKKGGGMGENRYPYLFNRRRDSLTIHFRSRISKCTQFNTHNG